MVKNVLSQEEHIYIPVNIIIIGETVLRTDGVKIVTPGQIRTDRSIL